MEDREIIDLYWARDEQAISATDEKYGAYCYTVANNILYNDEDSSECVNDTYFRAWNDMPPSRPSVLKLYLARIVRNLSLDRYRANHTAKRGGGEFAVLLDELAEVIPDRSLVEDQVETRELSAAIERFLGTLSERYRGVFLQRYFYAASVEEIAEKFGLKATHVAVILNRVRGKLRANLEEMGYSV